jgi:hypothetical protein
LSITFKLKHPVNSKSFNKHFWHLKESEAGFDDTFSSEVVYPIIEEEVFNSKGKCGTDFTQNSSTYMLTRQIRIEGCHYQLSEV